MERIGQNHNQACSHGFVADTDEIDDERPELPTNAEWRTDMLETRKRKRIDQAQLAQKVGTEQPQISAVETGAVGTSRLVMPICRALGIAPPSHLMRPEQRHWSRLGHRLQELAPAQFRHHVASVEHLVELEEQRRQRESEQLIPPLTPKNKKARPMGSASIDVPQKRQQGRRTGDELPFEPPSPDKPEKPRRG